MRAQRDLLAELDQLASAVKRQAGIPEQVAEALHDLILAGKLRPGERIVETRIARQLGVGQPTIREALGKLELAGLVVRYPNRGCAVTQLTEEECNQIFRVRLELEPLAAELAAENRSSTDSARLRPWVAKLQEAAREGRVEDFYRSDLELHKAIWQMARNPFLEKALAQIVVPLFAFVMIELMTHRRFDLLANAQEHEKLVEAILAGDQQSARGTARRAIEGFWKEGLALLNQMREENSAGDSSPGENGPRQHSST